MSAKDKIIYHYCSAGTLLKILDSKCLWLNQANVMNDSMECQWYRYVLDFIFGKLQADDRLDQQKLLDAYKQIILTGETTPKYMVCFSEDGDLLSQWRGYADDGRGFSIGFNVRKMNIPATPPLMNGADAKSLGLFNVIYDLTRQQQLIEVGLRKNVDGQKHYIEASALAAFASVFKNPGFAEEKEWRLVYSPLLLGPNKFDYSSMPHSFRETKYGIVPYFKWFFENKLDSIEEIVIGPQNGINQNDLKVILSETGFDVQNIKIRQSITSYRS